MTEYADNIDKAISFGESHLRQVGGKVKILRAEYEDMVANGWILGGRSERHRGLTTEERRKAILTERLVEIDSKEREFRELTGLVEDLKDLIGVEESDFSKIMRDHLREEISRYTGVKTFL